MHEHTHTHTYTHRAALDKWKLQATMKEVCLESGPKRMNRVPLPDAPGQGITLPLGRGDACMQHTDTHMQISIQSLSLSLPVGDNTGVVTDLVLIHLALWLLNKTVLLVECSDGDGASDCLPKVRVDWRATCWLKTFQLTWCCHVKPLQGQKRKEKWIKPLSFFFPFFTTVQGRFLKEFE